MWPLAPLLLLLGCALACKKGLEAPKPDGLEIVATADEVAGAWKVAGRILQSGSRGGVQEIAVWVDANTVLGNRASFFAPELDAHGQFEVSAIPDAIRGDPVVELSVVARTPAGRVQKSVLERKPSSRLPALGVSGGVVAFLVSLALPFWKGEPGRARYLLSLLLACLFTGTLILCLGMGLRRVSTPGRQEDITPIPFGSIYWGRYSDNVNPEWLFSLTSPPARTQPPQAQTPQAQQAEVPVDSGFGAPLWVLLMSVLGAGILTISLVVGEIGDGPGEDSAEMRRRIQKMVRHQFFILFAPVGAILVYQILAAARAVGSSFAVAIAAMGSGMTMNSLLNEAIRRADNIIKGLEKAVAHDTDRESQDATAAPQ
jgi:hypothetical protein